MSDPESIHLRSPPTRRHLSTHVQKFKALEAVITTYQNQHIHPVRLLVHEIKKLIHSVANSEDFQMGLGITLTPGRVAYYLVRETLSVERWKSWMMLGEREWRNWERVIAMEEDQGDDGDSQNQNDEDDPFFTSNGAVARHSGWTDEKRETLSEIDGDIDFAKTQTVSGQLQDKSLSPVSTTGDSKTLSTILEEFTDPKGRTASDSPPYQPKISKSAKDGLEKWSSSKRKLEHRKVQSESNPSASQLPSPTSANKIWEASLKDSKKTVKSKVLPVIPLSFSPPSSSWAPKPKRAAVDFDALFSGPALPETASGVEQATKLPSLKAVPTTIIDKHARAEVRKVNDKQCPACAKANLMCYGGTPCRHCLEKGSSEMQCRSYLTMRDLQSLVESRRRDSESGGKVSEDGKSGKFALGSKRFREQQE